MIFYTSPKLLKEKQNSVFFISKKACLSYYNDCQKVKATIDNNGSHYGVFYDDLIYFINKRKEDVISSLEENVTITEIVRIKIENI